jgi:zinc knuckle protein
MARPSHSEGPNPDPGTGRRRVSFRPSERDVNYPILPEVDGPASADGAASDGSWRLNGYLRFAPQLDQDEEHLKAGRINFDQFKLMTQHEPEWLWTVLHDMQEVFREHESMRAVEVQQANDDLEISENRVNSLKQTVNALSTTINSLVAQHQRELADLADQRQPSHLPSEEPRTRESTQQPVQSTVSVEADSILGHHKLMKIPDPPLLSDGKDPDFDSWMMAMHRKMRASAAMLPTEDYRMIYVASRTTGDAERYLAPRLRANAVDPFTTAQQMFDHLEKIYGNPNRAMKAAEDFHDLMMKPGQPFHEFLSRFMYLHIEGELMLNDRNLKLNLWRRLTKNLRQRADPALLKSNASFSEFSTAIGELADMLAVSDRLANERSTKEKAKDSGNDKSKTKDSDSGGKQKNVLPKRGQDTTKLDSDTKARYIKEGRCFGCGQTGHVSSECPSKDRAAVVAEVAVPNPGSVMEIKEDGGAGKV